MKPLFETILSHVESPDGDPDKPLQFQISALDYSTYTGRMGIGRIRNGVLKSGSPVAVMLGDKKQNSPTLCAQIDGKIIPLSSANDGRDTDYA